jgi:hypothetical protein
VEGIAALHLVNALIMSRMTKTFPPTGRFAFHSAAAACLGALLFVSCGKQAPDSPKQSSASASQATVAAVSTPQPSVPAGPGPNEKVCFQCNGDGAVVCRAPGCKAGKADCPGACLKLTRGTWVHMTVAGHDPSELWQKFPDASGKGGYQAWNQNHVGEVVAYQNGVAVNTGQCKVCSGTTRVTCPACVGKGTQACELCARQKYVPAAWSATDNPWFNRQPDLIRLKDGQVILGRVAATTGEERTIVTRDKKIVRVKASDILPKGEANVPTVQAPSAK